ncbi:hypothetical protein PR048_025057 [Dryococelus australis]|uniref:Uncharacterized protein n=1 Tax=Dryococelus australis TaxID=614101 RepID=A0ABQ9GQC1_9NEOP|nr:hypothetical protein PR048_025057 [Dryococelus australis]
MPLRCAAGRRTPPCDVRQRPAATLKPVAGKNQIRCCGVGKPLLWHLREHTSTSLKKARSRKRSAPRQTEHEPQEQFANKLSKWPVYLRPEESRARVLTLQADDGTRWTSRWGFGRRSHASNQSSTTEKRQPENQLHVFVRLARGILRYIKWRPIVVPQATFSPAATQMSHKINANSQIVIGAAVAERLACLANCAQSPAGSIPDFRKWESCRMMLLVGGISRESPIYPALTFQQCFILTSFHPHRLSRPTSFTLSRKVVSYSALTETAPRRVSFRQPPVSPPPPEQTRDQDSHESARATRCHRARTQLTRLSAGPSWHPTIFFSAVPAQFPPRRAGFNPRSVHSVFSQVGIVQDDAVCQRILSEISRFPRPFIPALLQTHLTSSSLDLKTLIVLTSNLIDAVFASRFGRKAIQCWDTRKWVMRSQRERSTLSVVSGDDWRKIWTWVENSLR